MAEPLPATPELDRWSRIINSGRWDTVWQFIDWLAAQDIFLAKFDQFDGFSDPMLVPQQHQPDQLMADFFDIDQTRIEAERRALAAASQKPRP